MRNDGQRITTCSQCGKETTNFKFCSSSCSAKYNNVLYPKREPAKRCDCGKAIARHVERCRKCYVENLKGDGPWFCYCGNEISKNEKKCHECKIRIVKDKVEKKNFSEENKNIKICGLCKKEKNNIDFFKGQNCCRTCCKKRTKTNRRISKEQSVAYKGGRCERCGYDKCIAALEFHHKNPEEKMFAISSNRAKMNEVLREELDKCELLCANCHRELHDDYQQSDLN